MDRTAILSFKKDCLLIPHIRNRDSGIIVLIALNISNKMLLTAVLQHLTRNGISAREITTQSGHKKLFYPLFGHYFELWKIISSTMQWKEYPFLAAQICRTFWSGRSTRSFPWVPHGSAGGQAMPRSPVNSCQKAEASPSTQMQLSLDPPWYWPWHPYDEPGQWKRGRFSVLAVSEVSESNDDQWYWFNAPH